MEWFVVLALLILLIILFRERSKKPPTWSMRQVESDDSTVVYRDGNGVLHREHDGCNGCIQLRAEQLQREGYVVVDVEIGRRNSGQL